MQISQFRRGDAVKATVLRYGPLGASVSVAAGSSEVSSPIVVVDTNQHQMGLILQDQIEYWAALNKRDPQVGEILNAYIQKVLHLLYYFQHNFQRILSLFQKMMKLNS